MKTILRALLALMPLSIGMACLVLCAALALPVQANAGGPAPAQFTIVHSDRTELGDDIAHYRYDVAMGPGKYDVVRIHRIVREKRPNKPVSTRDAVMLLPGNPNSFEGIFMAPMVTGVSEMDHSIVIFLAKNDIDVWGMDYGWALVPLDETDFEFMGQWGLAKDVAHAEAALSFVRSIRVGTGQGNGKLHVLGLSYGGQVAYPLVGEETVQPPGLRNVKGMIVLDIGVKLGNEGDREFYCAMAESDQALLDSNPPNSYANDIGLIFQALGYLASVDPGEESPFFARLTNWQAALFVGASTELMTPGNPGTWSAAISTSTAYPAACDSPTISSGWAQWAHHSLLTTLCESTSTLTSSVRHIRHSVRRPLRADHCPDSPCWRQGRIRSEHVCLDDVYRES